MKDTIEIITTVKWPKDIRTYKNYKIDGVLLTRCRDCIYHSGDYCHKNGESKFVYDSDYCSDGVQEED